MSILVAVIIILVLVALGVWAVQNIPNLAETPKQLIIVLVIVLGILFIALKAGLLS
jgi:hypothetical protein